MNPDDKLTQHTSQISRLEQVMTALAEAQVKTEDETAQLRRTMDDLAQAQAELTRAHTKTEHALAALAEAQAQTARQFQAYLNTRKN